MEIENAIWAAAKNLPEGWVLTMQIEKIGYTVVLSTDNGVRYPDDILEAMRLASLQEKKVSPGTDETGS